MNTGLVLGASGAAIWLGTHVSENRKKIKVSTATALYCVALVLGIAGILFLLGSMEPV